MSQEKSATRKCVRRNRTRVGKQVVVASAILLLLAGARLVGSQSNSSAAPSTQQTASPAVPAKANALPLDGLKLTDDQKTRIAKIRQHVEARREATIKNEALNSRPERDNPPEVKPHRDKRDFQGADAGPAEGSPDADRGPTRLRATRAAPGQTDRYRVTSNCASNACRTLARDSVSRSSLIFLSS